MLIGCAPGSDGDDVAADLGREHLAHGVGRVQPVFRVQPPVSPHVEAVIGELSQQKRIRDVETSDQKHEVEPGAKEENDQVTFVVMSNGVEKGHVTVELFLQGFIVPEDEGRFDLAVDEAGHDALLGPHPQFVRHEENRGLDQQEEDDPLVVRRPRLGLALRIRGPLSAIEVLLVFGLNPIGAVDPTVLGREIAADAVLEFADDRIAEVLRTGAEQRTGQANDQRTDGKEFEHRVVNPDFGRFKVFGDFLGDFAHR